MFSYLRAGIIAVGLIGVVACESAPPVNETAANGTMTIGEGPIWNQSDAEEKCPAIAAKHNGTWTGGWRTTVPNAMSVCEIAPAQPAPQESNLVIATNLNFDSGAAVLRPDSIAKLERVAAVLKANPAVSVRIIGHADNEELADDGERLDLSYRRAGAAKSELERMGIPSNLLSVIAAGDENPLVSNGTNAGRAVNRRVDFLVVP